MTEKFIHICLTAIFGTAVGFFYGWRVRGWQEGEIVQQTRAERAETALVSRIQAEQAINDAARAAGVIAGQTSEKIQETKREIKNLPALEIACRPDADRAGRLHNAIDVANNAIGAAAGYRAGQAMRDADIP